METVDDAIPGRYITVGWPVRYHDDFVVLCNSAGMEGSHGHLTAIPYRAVVTVTRVPSPKAETMLSQIVTGWEMSDLVQLQPGPKPRRLKLETDPEQGPDEGDDEGGHSAAQTGG